ncbi:hypothetical protein AX777_18405 [Sphingobium yanoikuyae]|uniref:Site-specific integrase n=1 Tax=Sphingobium yanoikuyae TaxID=13690 RepID=A0A177JR27_SPHYA|nr:tyrosine-type recombinase/integrase [Sphingobium yanoikuyae]OAH43789.1 hypothetical protein AX777_18405 [Sphingobium yanoikuyae]
MTKELSIARGRAGAMTAYSETVRMGLYQRIASEGLSPAQQKKLFVDEMRLYRDALEHEQARWQADPNLRDVSDPSRDLQTFETLWRAFSATGVVDRPSTHYARTHFLGLDEDEQNNLRLLLNDTPNFTANFQAEVTQALDRVGIPMTQTNLPLAMKIILEARTAAAHACRVGLVPDDFEDRAAEAQSGSTASVPALGSVKSGTVFDSTVPEPQSQISGLILPEMVPDPWRSMTPIEVAERFIAETPKMFEHRQSGKRASEQTGEQTLRQIRWAAKLFQCTMPEGRPMWTVSSEDLKNFDRWLDRLPVTFGKSSKDRIGSIDLEIVEQRALERVEDGELQPDQIGLTVPTANKHYRKIAQVHAFLRKKIPGLPAMDFGEFTQPDRKDEREARMRYTLEQGREIFSLPPWTGCVGEKDRFSAGQNVIHDSLYFVLLLVWYTGARREEICKLRIEDVGHIDGIYFLRIETTDTGRVKNNSAIRCIAVADEVVRLGFGAYVEALKAAGETLLFPELAPALGTKRKRGDVFYKLWWMYIRPMVPSLMRGQAMHSARHTVSDELKQQEIFLEFRNDLLGHKGQGGDGVTRYPSATRLRTVLSIVNRIPVVTDHLPDFSTITLLPNHMRQSRPTRKMGS